MKKSTSKLLVFGLAAVSAVSLIGFTACAHDEPDTPDAEDKHTHTYSTEWSYDETGHWHAPTCDDTTEVKDFAAHVYDNEADADCNVCGYVRTTKTAVEFIQSLDGAEIEGLNTYVSDYADVVSYLREKGVITVSDDERVDMNTTAGYFLDATEGALSETAFQFADKAYDYGGVYLIWWDLDGDYTAFRTFSTTTTIQKNGGRYTLYCSAVSGAYALAFKSVNEVVNSWGYSYGNNSYVDNTDKYDDWDAWNADKTSAQTAAEAAVSTQLKAFNDIDSTPDKIQYYTEADLITALRGAGYITALDVATRTNLNEIYTYTLNDIVTYVKLASSAYKYGDISIYYFDSSENNYSYYTYRYMYENLVNDGETVVYYGPSWADWYSEGAIYTHTGTEYDADGEQLILTVDAVIGNFAIVIDKD